MCSRRRNAPSVPTSLQRSASAINRRFSLPENWRRLAIATTSGSRRAPSSEAVSPVALPAPSTASQEEPDNPFREDFSNEAMFMSYLYSKLPETGVSPHIGTGGDRLLLGLSGIMSEAELHQIRMRLHQGERQKAARGELRLPLPAGLAHDRAGIIILNLDEEVQARLLLVFAKFRELQSARGVMRFLRTSGLPLPVRPVLGPSPHDVVWRDADSARVRGILQNPAYAGAYVYGRRQKDASQCRRGSVRATVKV